MTNPLIVALDFAQARQAVEMAMRIRDHVGGFKVGLELLMGPGPATVAAVAELGRPVFADAKLHDIPTTVHRAARALGAVGTRWVTAHAGGGRAMLESARQGLAEGAAGHETGILAVTVLTSIDQATLAATGVTGTPGKQVAKLARVAAAAGVEGVVCAVRELGDVHQVAPELVRVTPGIRLGDAEVHDQARVDTPGAAIGRGADWLVVGRPITRSPDPVSAAQQYLAAIKGAGEATSPEPEASAG